MCLHSSPEEAPANTIPLKPCFSFWPGTIIFNYLLLKKKKKNNNKTSFFFCDSKEEEQSRRRNVLVYEIVGINGAGFVSGFTDVSALCS